MPRKSSVNDQQLIESIQELYGPEITSGDLKGFCASRGLNYQTVSNKLSRHKIGRGRWNFEITQDKVEEIFKIDSLDDIYKYADKLIAVAKYYSDSDTQG